MHDTPARIEGKDYPGFSWAKSATTLSAEMGFEEVMPSSTKHERLTRALMLVTLVAVIILVIVDFEVGRGDDLRGRFTLHTARSFRRYCTRVFPADKKTCLFRRCLSVRLSVNIKRSCHMNRKCSKYEVYHRQSDYYLYTCHAN